MQKLYYSISEVSKIVDEEQHILRYWEKEFDQLRPKKNRAGNRTYSEKDLSTIKLIKKLLREDKLSLKGAKENIEGAILKLEETNVANSQQKFDFMAGKSKENERASKEISKDTVTVKQQELEELRGVLKDILDFLR